MIFLQNLTSKIQISFSLHETFEIADSLLQLYDLFFGSGRIFPIEKAIRDFIRLVWLEEIANNCTFTSCRPLFLTILQLLHKFTKVFWNTPKIVGDGFQVFEFPDCQIHTHILFLSSLTKF